MSWLLADTMPGPAARGAGSPPVGPGGGAEEGGGQAAGRAPGEVHLCVHHDLARETV